MKRQRPQGGRRGGDVLVTQDNATGPDGSDCDPRPKYGEKTTVFYSVLIIWNGNHLDNDDDDDDDEIHMSKLLQLVVFMLDDSAAMVILRCACFTWY